MRTGPVHILSTLLHELAHAWQHEHGTPSKPPHHNKEFREKCEAFGVPADEGGHDLGVRHGSPFEEYCRRHCVAFPSASGAESTATLPESRGRSFRSRGEAEGSKLKKWTCPCGVNVRVAISEFDATCNRCGERFARA